MSTRDLLLLAAALLAGTPSAWSQSVPSLYTIPGDPSEAFGEAVAATGDLDGDGVADLLVGGPGEGLGLPPSAGVVRALSGRTGDLIWSIDGDSLYPQQKGGFQVSGFGGTVDVRFGAAVVGLGDVDGDEIDDFAASAPGSGFPQTGRVGVYSGADGQLLYPLSGTAPGARYGAALGRLPDLDDDGVDELLIGAPAGLKSPKKTNGKLGPYAEVRSGADGSLIHQVSPDVAGHGSLFGTSIAAVDDVDQDGKVEFAVGAPVWGNGLGTVGAFFLYSGATGEQKRRFTRNAPHSRFGAAIAGGIDVNGDGVGDLLVGAPDDLLGHGAVYVYSGRVGAPEDDGLEYAVTVEGRDEFGFGSALSRAGDVDLDGTEDFLVGVPEDASFSFDEPTDANSHVYLLSGADGETIARVNALAPGWRLGSSLAFLGDPLGTGSRAFALGGPGFGLGNGVVLAAYVPGPSESQGLTGPLNVLEGRAGGPTLVKLDLGSSSNSFGGYQDIVFGPLVVVPKINGDSVAADLLVETKTAFSPFDNKIVGKNPSEAATGDFNLDGRDDFATANSGGNSFSVVTATPSGGSGFQSVGGGLGPVSTFDTGLNTTPRAIAVEDIGTLGAGGGRDGFDDVLISGDVGVACYLNDGMGGFALADLVPVPTVTDIAVGQLNPGVDAIPDAIVTSGDMDGNGLATVLLGGADGSLTPAGTFAVGPALASVLVADLDGDGDDDALTVAHFVAGGLPSARIQAWLNDGSGAFAAGPWPGSVSSSVDGNVPTYGAIADLDSDGTLDAVFTSNDNLALPPAFFEGIEPVVEITVLTNLGDDLAGDWQGFDVSTQGTAYAGRVVVPIVEDVFTDPADPTANDPDLVLVWTVDELAGQGPVEQPVSFIGLFVGNGEGTFVDPSPNQFDLGDQPGDGDAGDVGRPDDDPGIAVGGDGMIDLVFPNLLSNSLTCVLNDGAGGVGAITTVEGVDELDPKTLPPGVWSGGPRVARLAHLDGDDLLDVVVYNDWRDDFTGDVRASISAYRAIGEGQFEKTAYRTLARAGELLVVDTNQDGLPDVVVSQTEGGNADDSIVVFRGDGLGGLSANADVVPIPGGRDLTGGLVEGGTSPFGYERAVFSTALDPDTGTGRVLAFPVRPEGLGGPAVSELESSWFEVEGLDIGDLDLDGRLDLAIGTRDGRLVLARGLGEGLFVERAVNPAAAQVGGGALSIGFVDGDFLPDIVSSKAAPGGANGVHLLSGIGEGDFKANVIAGVSSQGDLGAQRPLLLDFDGDLTLDVVLSHGTANTISILLSELNDVEVLAEGEPGSGSITPTLTARGYTTLGGELVVDGGLGLGGAWAWLIVGTDVQLGQVPSISVEKPSVILPLKLDGQTGVPGDGNGVHLSGRLPDDPSYVGFEFMLQLVVADPSAAGLPLSGLSTSRVLKVRMLD